MTMRGSELPGLVAARDEALAGAREMVADWIRIGGLVDGRLEIHAECQNLVDVLEFADVARIAPQSGLRPYTVTVSPIVTDQVVDTVGNLDPLEPS
jgi:hypothetical protein